MTNLQTIFITGATDGIGQALAEQYAAAGHHVIALGRRPHSLLAPQLATAVTYCQVDLAHADAAEKVCHFLDAHNCAQIDHLIHNAGVGYYGPVGDQSAASINEMLAVNLWAPIALTHALLPRLQRARGKITFISSLMSALPGPDYAVYTATKAALEGFARALRIELVHEVTVTIIRPGATRTGMHAKMGIPSTEMAWEKFAPAEQVAAKIRGIIARGKKVATVGFNNSLLYAAGHNASFLIDGAMRRKRQTRKSATASSRPCCVITGAADGIGKALATRYAQAGYAILGIDVDADRAASCADELRLLGADVEFVIADLATAVAIPTLINALTKFGPANVFIHNAGISHLGRFADSDIDAQQAVLNINLRAPLQLTAAILQHELLAADGAILFLSSLSKYVGYPGAAVYAASKDGLAAYARSLRVALSREHNVLTVYPGPTRTVHARRYSPDNSREKKRMPPETLAEHIFHAQQKRKAALIPGLGNKLFALLGHTMPPVTENILKREILGKLADG